MRYALVDDATLESAKRIEGRTITKNTLEAAGDILAMENLIQAILFCDRVLYLSPGGIKKSHNIKFFESFQQVILDDETHKKIIMQANHMTDRYIPCIEGGKFTDEFFCAFFNALDIELRFVWEKKAGSYCLSPRMIEKRKGLDNTLNKIMLSIIQTELSDTSFLTEINPRIPLLYDSEGQIINNCYEVKDKHGKRFPTELSKEAEGLFRALNYMSLRANLHILAARELKADLLMSPMRSQLQWVGYNLFAMKNKELNLRINCGGNRMAYAGNRAFPAVQLQGLPMFAYWIAKNMPERSGLLRAAAELREEKEFVAVRQCLSELCERITEDITADTEKALVYMARLNRLYGKILRKYKAGIKGGSYSAFAALMYSSPQARGHFSGIENFMFRLEPADPEFETADNTGKHFGAVYRPVRSDLANIAAMDESFDLLTSEISFKTEEVLQNIKLRSKPDGLPV